MINRLGKLTFSGIAAALCIVVLGLDGNNVWAQDPVHRVLTTADGLPSNTVYCATVDGEGFMWFATDAGVSRFDGRNFRNFTTADGLSSDDVVNLATDSQGRVWFLTMNNGPSLWENGTIRSRQNDPRLQGIPTNTKLTSIVEESPDRFWLAGNDRVLHYLDLAGDTDTTWTDIFMLVATVSSGELLGANRREVYSLSRARVKRLRSIGFDDSMIATASTYSPVPPIMIRGTRLFQVGRDEDRIILEQDDLFDPFIHERAWQDPLGTIWIRRRDRGIDRVLEPDTGNVRLETWFSDTYVNTVYTDVAGGYWVCTRERGVLQIHPRHGRSKAWITNDKIGPGAILSLQIDEQGDPIAGTSFGNILKISDGKVHVIWPKVPDDVPLGRITGLQRQAEQLWVAADLGLMRLDLVPPYAYERGSEIASDSILPGIKWRSIKVNTVSVGPSGEVFGGYGYLTRVHSDHSSITQTPLVKYPRFRTIEHICQDRSGRVWFDQGEVLYCYHNGELTEQPPPDASAGPIVDITAFHGDTILVAHAQGGLHLYYRGQLLDSWSGKPGYPPIECHTMHVADEQIWVSADQGIIALVVDHGRFVISKNHVPMGGLDPNGINEIQVFRSKLIAGTDQGVIVLPILPSAPLNEPPELYVRGMYLGAQPVPIESTLSLPSNHPNLQIRLGALALNVGNVEYRFKSKAEQNWSEVSSGLIDLVSLSPGTHVIQAAARLQLGEWSQPLELKISVAAAWYQRGWVQLLAVLLLMALVGAVVGAIIKIRHRNTLFSMRQKEMIHNERSRIAADLHDDLGADLSDLLLHARSIRKGQDQGHASLERVEARLLDAIRTVDETIWAIDPKRDTLKATIDHIERSARGRLEHANIGLTTNFEVPEESIMVRAAKRRELHLIIKEAVNNAAKHSNASSVELSCSILGNMLSLKVADDGIGPTNTNSGHGVQNMQHRVERLGGSFRLGPNSPQGTNVVILLPLINLITSDEVG